MKRLGRIGGFLIGLVLLAAGLAPGIAAAEGYVSRYPHRFEHRGSFPNPPDPWRNWGVREHHYYPGIPHYPRTVVVPPRAAWVPGYWGWTGYQWVWVPGYWVR